MGSTGPRVVRIIDEKGKKARLGSFRGARGASFVDWKSSEAAAAARPGALSRSRRDTLGRVCVSRGLLSNGSQSGLALSLG